MSPQGQEFGDELFVVWGKQWRSSDEDWMNLERKLRQCRFIQNRYDMK
jgi:hypothetical protein